MGLSVDDVEHVARLARVELSDEEKEEFSDQLGSILGYIEKLGELDTDNVEPMMHASVAGNVMREDEVMESLEHEKVLQNAPEREDRFFRVKKVIE